MNADGSGRRRLTFNGAANFAPCFFPDGKRILFSSNFEDPERRRFQLYAMRDDGSGIEPVTTEGSFNCFPMFSPDGKRLVFISNRFAAQGMRLYDICSRSGSSDPARQGRAEGGSFPPRCLSRKAR